MRTISEQSNQKRVRLLYEVNGGLMIVGSFVAVLIFSWLAHAWANSTALYTWIGFMICAFALRHAIQLSFRKRAAQELINWEAWEKIYAVGLTSTALGWGAAGWLLGISAPQEVHYILAFIIIGLISGAASNYSVSKVSTFSVMLPMVIPFSISMFVLGNRIGISVGILINIFMVLLMSASFRRRDFTLHAWTVADERERLSRELIDTQAKATQSAKMASLGLMAAGIAHEINTPLAIISTCAQMLQEFEELDRRDPALVKSLADQIDTTVTRIAKIVAGLRSFSRQDERDDARDFEVGEMIESTLELCRERFKLAGIKLDVQPLEGAYKVTGHSTQLSQVLLNLLNNAADATEGLQSRWVSISAVSGNNETLQINVVDSGSGIPKELHEKLMEPFFTTKDFGKGTGLGLSVAHGIMLAHKGTLTIDAEHQNTCFVMQLPLAA